MHPTCPLPVPPKGSAPCRLWLPCHPQAKALDLETSQFDDAAQRLREENAQILARLAQLQGAGLPPSIGEHTEGGKALARSVSHRDPELDKALKARERVQTALCALDGPQRKLLNRCFSFDNRCSAFRKGGSAK